MPYVLWKKNGKRMNTPFVFTAADVENLDKDKHNSYVLVNTTTRRMCRVGKKRTRSRRGAR